MRVTTKIGIGVGCVLLALNLLVVPYESRYGDYLGYSTLSSPIKFSSYDGKKLAETSDPSSMKDGRIDFRRIGLQSGAILLLMGGVVVFSRIMRE